MKHRESTEIERGDIDSLKKEKRKEKRQNRKCNRGKRLKFNPTNHFSRTVCFGKKMLFARIQYFFLGTHSNSMSRPYARAFAIVSKVL